MKRPAVDLSRCSMCLGCIEVCPAAFRENAAGYLEVIELAKYPENEIDDAIKYCPEDCIFWDQE